MAGWPRQCYCCINDPKGVDVVLFLSIPVCLPFSTQTKCSCCVAVAQDRLCSASTTNSSQLSPASIQL